MNSQHARYVLPPCAIPSIPWVALWLDGCNVSSQLIYQKQTLRNRYALAGVNGLIWLSIPVESTQGKPTPFHDIKIAGNLWKRVHWKTIQSSYARAAYWDHYSPGLQQIFAAEHILLTDLFDDMIQWIRLSGVQTQTMQGGFRNHQAPQCDVWDPSFTWPDQTPYPQVFSDRHPFQHNLSVIDLLMNLGPKSALYLEKVLISMNSLFTRHPSQDY
jgi:hypothetical protein